MAQVNSTSITVNVNNFQPAYSSLGLGPIPAGTTVDSAVKTIQTALEKMLGDNWPKSGYGSAPTQTDSAIMAPWKANIPGTAPKCVIDAIKIDFKAWGLPVDDNAITLMAKEITQQISNHGGNTGTFYGVSHVTSSETIYWGVSFTTAVVVDNPMETGIIYGFGAVFSLD